MSWYELYTKNDEFLLARANTLIELAVRWKDCVEAGVLTASEPLEVRKVHAPKVLTEWGDTIKLLVNLG